MKHKHADLIHAWADGAQIQCKQHGYENCWADIGYPNWENPYCVYRIKPEPKPDIVKRFYLESNTLCGNRFSEAYTDHDLLNKPSCIKCTFDGETKKLKAVEVL